MEDTRRNAQLVEFDTRLGVPEIEVIQISRTNRERKGEEKNK